MNKASFIFKKITAGDAKIAEKKHLFKSWQEITVGNSERQTFIFLNHTMFRSKNTQVIELWV